MAAKKKGRPATSERDDVTIKMDRMVATDCRFVAEHRKITLAEYVTELVRPLVAKDLDRVLKERGR